MRGLAIIVVRVLREVRRLRLALSVAIAGPVLALKESGG
jgi:hypothetical protein